MAPAIRYTVTLWADMATEDGFAAYSPREFEKLLLANLRKVDADIDLEVVDAEPFDDDDPKPEHHR